MSLRRAVHNHTSLQSLIPLQSLYLWQLCLYTMHNPGLSLGRLQQLVELFGVKLEALEEPGRPGHDQQEFLNDGGEQGPRLGRLLSRLHQQLLQVLAQLVEVPNIRRNYKVDLSNDGA